MGKSRNCLAPNHKKRKSYSDGQQFHQYQQNKQPHLTSNHWTQKGHETNDVGNPGANFGHAHQGGRVKPVNEIPTFHPVLTHSVCSG